MLPQHLTNEESIALNRLARERMKLKLLQDIRLDMEICKIEGWDIKEYLIEIKDMINSLGNDRSRNQL